MDFLFNQAKAIFLLFAISIFSNNAFGQGCVAIRGNGGCGAGAGNSFNLTKGQFNPQVGFRYFESFRHFRGSHQEENRIEDGTQVINDSYFLDLTLGYGITDRLYATATLPLVHHKRSSMYEHGGNPPNGLGERHETRSYGVSDVRLGLGYWFLDPSEHDFSFALGLGAKLPTGKSDYTDLFYNQGEDRDIDREAVVDQSIQPGDGGYGVTLDFQGIYFISHSFLLNANLFYLSNVTETNGVLTRNGNSEFSSPDQYGMRLGAFYNSMHNYSLYLGGRMEGVPSEDLIGGSAGYRRPGYVVSVEPGLGYGVGKNCFMFLGVPVSVVRNRTQSYLDKQSTLETGVYRHGDAAFADYSLNFTFSYRFGGSKETHSMPGGPVTE